MKRDLILKEMDSLIFDKQEEVNFRIIAQNLNIAPSTISYQFNNQDNLYKEYLKFKLKQFVTPNSLSSFENLMLGAGNQIYEIFTRVSKDVTFDMVDNLIASLFQNNFEIIDMLYARDYGQVERDKELAIISNIIISMAFPKNYSKILDNDLLQRENRERLIRNIIKREVE